MFNPFTEFPVSDDWDAHVARNAFGGGIDYEMPVGTPLPLAEDARVEFLPNWGTGGHTVRMTYADGSQDFYMHCSAFIYGPEYRKARTNVAYSGGAKGAPGAGNSTGPHLHAHGYNTAGVRVPPFHGVTTGPASAGEKPLESQEEDTEMKLVHHIQGADQAIYLDSDYARTLASNIGNLDVLKARYGMVVIDTTQGTDVGLRPLDAAKAWAIENDPKNAGASPAEIARLVDAAVGDDFARVHVKLDSITKGEGDIITELRKVASSVSGIVLQVDVTTLADRLSEALGKNLSIAVANELSKRLAS